MEKDDKGSTLIRIGVSGWNFLLVPAYPGCPGSKAVKRSLLLLLFMTTTGFANLLPVWYQQLLTRISHKSRFPDILCLPKNFCNPLTVLAPLKLQPYGAIQICLLLLLLLVPPARPKEALLPQHDAMCRSKSCQLLHISVGTTCTTNPEQIEVSELELQSTNV